LELHEFRVQEFRSSGVQEFRSSGVQEFRLEALVSMVKVKQSVWVFHQDRLPSNSATPELL